MDAVKAHVEYLRTFKLSTDEIATLAGAGSNAIAKMIWEFPEHKRNERITASLANRILAARFDPFKLNPKSLVDSAGVRRRLQALLVADWTVPLLAKEFGMDRRNMLKLTRAPQVAAATFVRVIELCERLWLVKPPPVSGQALYRTRTMVQRNGWVGIGAWDDETINDPNAKPNLRGEDDAPPIVDSVKVQRVFSGHAKFKTLSRDERLELVRRWNALGYSKTQFDEQFRTSGTVSSKLYSIAVPDYERKSA